MVLVCYVMLPLTTSRVNERFRLYTSACNLY